MTERKRTEATLVRAKEVASGEEGLARFTDLRPDLVILDIHMPGMDGREVLRTLRGTGREAGDKPTPVLVVTADVLRSTWEE